MYDAIGRDDFDGDFGDDDCDAYEQCDDCAESGDICGPDCPSRIEAEMDAAADRYHDDDGDDRSAFADPGGRSALRAATRGNPRNLPCQTCREPNRLTPADVARGYQCDECADRAEGGGW